jgi:hypothetical protein
MPKQVGSVADASSPNQTIVRGGFGYELGLDLHFRVRARQPPSSDPDSRPVWRSLDTTSVSHQDRRERTCCADGKAIQSLTGTAGTPDCGRKPEGAASGRAGFGIVVQQLLLKGERAEAGVEALWEQQQAPEAVAVLHEVRRVWELVPVLFRFAVKS